jgi:hypothetical protein
MNNRLLMSALNIISGLALLVAASWFSYNLFAARDARNAVTISQQQSRNDELNHKPSLD